MREFVVNLTDSLGKGLRAFDPKLNKPMLDECFNFQTSEIGLEPYRPLKAVGWQSAYFNYVEIADQTGQQWYWYPVFDGHILSGPNVPSEPTTGMDPIPVNSSPVQWIEIFDENLEVWKLYPDPTTGFTRCTDTTSLSGVGLPDLQWRGTTGETWILRFSEVHMARYSVKVA